MGRKVHRRTHLISNGEEAPIGIIEKLHIHGRGKIFAHLSEASGTSEQGIRRPACLLNLRSQVRQPGSEMCRKPIFTPLARKDAGKNARFSKRQIAAGRQFPKQPPALRYGVFSQRTKELVWRRRQNIRPSQVTIKVPDP